MRVSMKRLETSLLFSFNVVTDPANVKTSTLLSVKMQANIFPNPEKQVFEDPYETLWRDETASGSKAIRYKQYFYNSTVLFTETEN